MQGNNEDLIQSALNAMEAAKASLRGDIEALRARINELHAQRQKLTTCRISFADYSQLIREKVMRLADAYEKTLYGNVRGERFVDHQLTCEGINGSSESDYSQWLQGDVTFDALCFLFPEAIIQKLINKVSARYGEQFRKEDDLPLDERTRCAEQLFEEIKGLEKQVYDLQVRLHSLSQSAGQH
ncbi:MAG: hypothetical protein M0Q95_08360 [Porticoccaceae bacterium]|jgi:polyhydroxyalkanoate synthesis regulator phasin|nr:hypothetical protein [Porticoccaceae bacterium]